MQVVLILNVGREPQQRYSVQVEDMHVPCTSCLHYLLYVFVCIRTMAIWPSGLRRQNQDLVRKGEGSNPSVVINHFHIRRFCLVVP
jgi:hypothetical protein